MLSNQAIPKQVYLELDELEGPSVPQATWHTFQDMQGFMGALHRGIQSRSTLSNEFGPLSSKSTGIVTIQLIQTSGGGGEDTITISHVNFVDFPASEVLVEDQEGLAIRQGSTLNKGILMVRSIMSQLGSQKVCVYIYIYIYINRQSFQCTSNRM